MVEVEEEPVPLAEMKVEKNTDNTTVLLLCFIGAAAVLVAVFAKKSNRKRKTIREENNTCLKKQERIPIPGILFCAKSLNYGQNM